MSVQASHLLVKHQGSRRPASWKDPDGKEIKNRSKDAAIKTLMEYRATIVGANDPKAKFAELAKVNSDCSSAQNGGDLGPFTRGQMQKPFEDATYALKVGEISDMVDTESGVHIILRTA